MANIALSDLFFNYSHTCYTAAYNEFESVVRGGAASLFYPPQEKLREAIRKDAEEFLGDYAKILRCAIPTAEELADDFMRRL